MMFPDDPRFKEHRTLTIQNPTVATDVPAVTHPEAFC
jgi:hypothetical protein